MRLELISFPLCPFVHRAAILLHEKGAAFGVRYIDLRNKPDWFLAISPRGRVPVLLAEERPLFESLAIFEFLDETTGARLLPADPFERARQRAFMGFSGDVFSAHYKATSAASEEELAAGLAALRGQLVAFENALAGPFFAGPAFGLVDAAIAPALQRLVFAEELGLTGAWEGLPKVAAWARLLAVRSSVVQGLPPDFAALYRSSLARSEAMRRRLSLPAPV